MPQITRTGRPILRRESGTSQSPAGRCSWSDGATLSVKRAVSREGYGACMVYNRGSRRNWHHAQLGMTAIISSTGSCQLRCVSLDVATILCIVTQHDRDDPEAWSYARHEQDLLTREDEKDQNGLVLAHDGDTLSDPGAYFFL